MEELNIEYIDIDKLTNYENNSKIHTKEQIEHIANSIKEFGFNDPLGIAGENNLVLEGNGRIEAAKMLEITKLPCIRLDHLSNEEQQAYVIAHNSLNLETGFDNNILYKELEKLKEYKFDNFGLDVESLYNNFKNDNFYNEMLKNQTEKLVRNKFECFGKYKIPSIKKQAINLTKRKLRSFSNTKYNDVKNQTKIIHFFIHDYKFEQVYNNPSLIVSKLEQYYCLLTPDFSLYTDMPLALQIYNTFKNRWCGAYWQSLGLNVIPTVSWSDDTSFEFCFDGVEKGSIVAISTHGNRKAKNEFMRGYNKMLEIIEPTAIICYGKPFQEMKGNLIIFPYNHHEHNEVDI